MDIHVECEAGPNGDPEPRRLRLGATGVVVAEIVDRWPAFGHHYFKVRGTDGGIYIVRRDAAAGTWRLTFYQAPEAERVHGPYRDPQGRS
jgi:hypothetical protein